MSTFPEQSTPSPLFVRQARTVSALIRKAGLRKSVSGACSTDFVSAANLPQNQKLYDNLIDSFSMRTFVPKTADSGHDHFFNTFEKFGGTDKRHVNEWVDEVASRAAAQNEQYLELMETPDFKDAASPSRPASTQTSLNIAICSCSRLPQLCSAYHCILRPD